MPDQKSLYLGSPWRVEGSQEDDVRMRSRIVGAVDNPDLKSLVFDSQNFFQVIVFHSLVSGIGIVTKAGAGAITAYQNTTPGLS